MVVVTNLSIWNLALMNSGLSARDLATHEYCRGCFSGRGTEESPPRGHPLEDPNPWDRGLGGKVLGDSAGYWPEEAPIGFGLGAVLAEEKGAPPAPGELCVPHGLGGFKDPGIVFLVPEVGGLSAFGDSPLIGTFCAEVSGLMSLGTLHEISQVRS
jgi:hypothetical protein